MMNAGQKKRKVVKLTSKKEKKIKGALHFFKVGN